MRRESRSRACYALLLHLYPRSFRRRFAAEMEQTFADMLADRRASGRPVTPFLASIYFDTTAGLINERITDTLRPGLADRPRCAALLGVLSAAPLVGLNFVVMHRLDPLFTMIRPGEHTGPFELPILLGSIALLPVGAALALIPAWRAARGAPRRFPALNIAIAVLLLAGFAPLMAEFSSEVVRCDVLHVPNCD
jgi:hypothetical protein